jgi:hypothetical protein
VKAVGTQPLDNFKGLLDNFKGLLTEEGYRKCANNPHIGKTWFKLTTDVFVAYLFRVSPQYYSCYSWLQLILSLRLNPYSKVVFLCSLAARDCRGLR